MPNLFARKNHGSRGGIQLMDVLIRLKREWSMCFTVVGPLVVLGLLLAKNLMASDYNSNNFVVEIDGDVSLSQAQSLVGNDYIVHKKIFSNPSIFAIENIGALDHDSALIDIRSIAEIESACPDWIADIDTNDPYYNIQEPYLNRIHAESAWSLGHGDVDVLGNEVVIAVFDSGISINDVEIFDNLWNNISEVNGVNGVDDDGNGYIDDKYGYAFGYGTGTINPGTHGTRVAQVANAVTDNGHGMAGVAYNAKLMACTYAGFDQFDENIGLLSTAIEGFSYIKMMKDLYVSSNGILGSNVFAVNCSFGFFVNEIEGNHVFNCQSEDFSVINSVALELAESGIIIVSSSTNEAGLNLDLVGSPIGGCMSPNIITVSSINTSGELEMGIAAVGEKAVDLFAYGSGVYVGDMDGPLFGSSFAAPHVSGTIALAYANASSDFMNDYYSSPYDGMLKMKHYIMSGSYNMQLDGNCVHGTELDMLNSCASITSYGANDHLESYDIECVSVRIDDSCGNSNGVASSGELIQVYPTIYYEESDVSSTRDMIAYIDIASHRTFPHVEIADQRVKFQMTSGNTITESLDPFVLFIGRGVPVPSTLEFVVTTYIDTGINTFPFSIDVQDAHIEAVVISVPTDIESLQDALRVVPDGFPAKIILEDGYVGVDQLTIENKIVKIESETGTRISLPIEYDYANHDPEYSDENNYGVYIRSSQVELLNLNISYENSINLFGEGVISVNNSSLILEDCSISLADANPDLIQRGGGINSSSSQVTISDCSFENCQAETFGGAIYCGSQSDLQVQRTSFSNCTIPNANQSVGIGGAIYVYGSSASINACTFIDCYTYCTSGIHYGHVVYCSGSTAELSMIDTEIRSTSSLPGYDPAAAGFYLDNLATCNMNNVLVANYDAVFKGSANVARSAFVGQSSLTIHSSCDLIMNSSFVNVAVDENANQIVPRVGLQFDYCSLPILYSSFQGTNIQDAPIFVNDEEGDFRQRFDSPLLDRGDPSLGIDFDLTNADIGWSPVYPEVEISGITEISEVGHYRVTSSATLHSGDDVIIPDGTVLKMDGASNLFIKDSNPTNGYNITAGDPNGARTSIVGSESYSSISFGDDATGAPVADCSFNGVLFNRLTSPNVPGFLKFSNCNVSLDGEGRNVAFNMAENVELYFAEVCQGDFKNFDFSSPQIHLGDGGFGWLTIANSDIDLININFDPVPGARDGDTYPWFWKVLHAGTVPGNPDHIIRDCVFPSQDNQSYAIPLYASGAEFNLHHNQFTEVEVGAISASTATLNMNNGAMNSFVKTLNQDYLGYSIIAGVQSPMDLYCGYNTFVYPTLNTGYMFVEDACVSSDWRNNFWGLSCNNPVDPTNFIPACVSNVQPTLSTCPDTFTPCGPQTSSASTLYSLGEAADEIQNYEAACVYWAQLLLDFPDSKYGTSVTGSIKAIGLLTEYGTSNYGQIRSDLEAAAVVTEPTNFLLSVFQQCSALCVEARHGDRTAALALLDALLVEVTGNKDAVFLVNAAIAEIGLWEEEGGLSAAGPEMDQARFVRQMQKLRAYQQALLPMGNMERASSEAPGQEATVQAATFQLHGSYPNPFNPVTTIDLDCLGDVPLLLEIYNLAGQRVDVLHQGEIAAGRHLFQWNAERMASGLYLARAEQGSHTATHKLILLH